jgi:hypothetical protein
MTGLGALLLYKVSDWTGATLVVALIFCVLAVIAILETVGRNSVNDIQESLAEARGMRHHNNKDVPDLTTTKLNVSAVPSDIAAADPVLSHD